MKVTVEATVTVEVEIPDDINAEFFIEENGCPGTSAVGAAIAEAIAHGEETSTCWACALRGRNKIVAINGVAV